MPFKESTRPASAFPVRQPGSFAAARSLVQLVMVLAVAAACLRGADEIPGLLTGAVRGVRQFDDLGLMERALGWKFPVPSYFPDFLGWPPAKLRAYGQTAATALFVRRDNSDPWLLVGIGSGQNVSLPLKLVPAPLVLQEGPGQVNGQPAVVRRVRDADGTAWTEIAWNTPGRSILLRYRGPVDELDMIASSIPERLP